MMRVVTNTLDASIRGSTQHEAVVCLTVAIGIRRCGIVDVGLQGLIQTSTDIIHQARVGVNDRTTRNTQDARIEKVPSMI